MLAVLGNDKEFDNILICVFFKIGLTERESYFINFNKYIAEFLISKWKITSLTACRYYQNVFHSYNDIEWKWKLILKVMLLNNILFHSLSFQFTIYDLTNNIEFTGGSACWCDLECTDCRQNFVLATSEYRSKSKIWIWSDLYAFRVT